ncbi:MAG: hypothetical protein OHK006_07620 [Thermodesulfovibrionales bacterium]
MNAFRRAGLKLTPQRIAILEYLEGNTDHPSAEDIYQAVSKRFPTMSFATVYNTLAALSRKGGVLELSIDPSRRRYDPNVVPHNHLICTSCRRIDDIHVDFSLRVPEELKHSYEITGNHVEFYGICPACRERRAR